jgi:hypothetical protein
MRIPTHIYTGLYLRCSAADLHVRARCRIHTDTHTHANTHTHVLYHVYILAHTHAAVSALQGCRSSRSRPLPDSAAAARGSRSPPAPGESPRLPSAVLSSTRPPQFTAQRTRSIAPRYHCAVIRHYNNVCYSTTIIIVIIICTITWHSIIIIICTIAWHSSCHNPYSHSVIPLFFSLLV